MMPSVDPSDEDSVEHSALQAARDALVDGLLDVCRAADRGEEPWALDVRRATARLLAARAAARARQRRADDQAGEP